METYLAIGNDAAVVAQSAATNETNTVAVSSDTSSVSDTDMQVKTGSVDTSAIEQTVEEVADEVVDAVGDADVVRVITMLDDQYSLHMSPVMVNLLQNSTDARVESIVTLPSGDGFDNQYTLACNTFSVLEEQADSVLVFSAKKIQRIFNDSVNTVVANRVSSLNTVERIVGTDSMLGEVYSTVTQKTLSTLTPEQGLVDRLMGREVPEPDTEEVKWYLISAVRDCLAGGNALTHRPKTGHDQTVVVEGPESHVSDSVVETITEEVQAVESVYGVTNESRDSVKIMVVTNGVSASGDIEDMYTQADSDPSDFSNIVNSMRDIHAYGDDTEDNPLFKYATDEEPGAA